MLLRAGDPLPHPPHRVLVTGTTGAGKSHLARRLDRVLGLGYVELDGLHHGPGWARRPKFHGDVAELAARETWITEWQYAELLGPMLTDRCDLVVWVDPPRARQMRQVIMRTLRRRIRRERLWSDNVEPPLWTVLTDPDHIVRWAWRTHGRARARLAELAAARPELPVVRLRGRGETQRWVDRWADHHPRPAAGARGLRRCRAVQWQRSARLPPTAENRPAGYRAGMDDRTTDRRPWQGRAVVTGGAGFLGSWTCERLLDDGAEVVAVDSLLTGNRANVEHLLDHPRFTFVETDVSSGLDVAGHVDLVMHLASPASPVHYLRFPIETLQVGSAGTAHALDLAERDGARFLLASTSEVYGDPLEHPQPESYWGNVNPVGPRSVYDEAKRYAEALTSAYRRERGVDTAIARIFNTYGPRMAVDDGRVVPTFAEQALNGRPLTVAGDGSQTRSLCYVDDTVEGLLRLAASSRSGPVNIGGEAETSMLELAEEILRLTSSSSSLHFVDLPQDDPQVRRPDLTLARQELGWSPGTPLREGLLRTLPWIAEELGLAPQFEEARA